MQLSGIKVTIHKAAASIALGLSLLPAVAHASPFGPPVREYGGATPIAESRWILATDYPESALRQEMQGRVVVAFKINATGKLVNCNVEVSSGRAILDAVPCKALERRAKFKPRLAGDGSATEANGRYSVDFWLP